MISGILISDNLPAHRLQYNVTNFLRRFSWQPRRKWRGVFYRGIWLVYSVKHRPAKLWRFYYRSTVLRAAPRRRPINDHRQHVLRPNLHPLPRHHRAVALQRPLRGDQVRPQPPGHPPGLVLGGPSVPLLSNMGGDEGPGLTNKFNQ